MAALLRMPAISGHLPLVFCIWGLSIEGSDHMLRSGRQEGFLEPLDRHEDSEGVEEHQTDMIYIGT